MRTRHNKRSLRWRRAHASSEQRLGTCAAWLGSRMKSWTSFDGDGSRLPHCRRLGEAGRPTRSHCPACRATRSLHLASPVVLDWLSSSAVSCRQGCTRSRIIISGCVCQLCCQIAPCLSATSTSRRGLTCSLLSVRRPLSWCWAAPKSSSWGTSTARRTRRVGGLTPRGSQGPLYESAAGARQRSTAVVGRVLRLITWLPPLSYTVASSTLR